MKIRNILLYLKYKHFPVRIKMMWNKYVCIAEGHLIAEFDSIDTLRKVFPFGNYTKLYF